MILGLDVSTSVTGASVINKDGKLIFCEAWRTDKKGLSFYDKLSIIRKRLRSIKQLFKIDAIVVEEPLMGFKSGFSSAQTITKLQRFNGAVCWICKEAFNKEASSIRASSARKQCGIKVARGQNAKQVVLEYLLQTEEDFDISYTKNGNPVKGTYDMADSIVIARAAFLQQKTKKT
tara:strand:+ start:1849 stop:2376 length:528 start_codon:yes stop_codon:yes gene_type:complete